MNQATLELAITVDDKGSYKLRDLGNTAEKAGQRGERSFGSMRDKLNQLKGSTDLTLASMVKLGAVSLAGLVGSLGAVATGTLAVVTHAGEQAKEMENLSRLAGMNVKDFQEAAFATERYGVNQEKLADISKDFSDKLGDFIANEGGEFADFFDNVGSKIGLTAQQLQGLSGPDALLAVKQAMDAANLSAEEQTFYLEAIASDASLLIPLLADNGRELKENAARARELGVALSEIEVEQLVAAQHATSELFGSMSSLRDHVAAQLAPVITDLSHKIIDGMEGGVGGVDSLAERIGTGLLTGIGAVVETMRFFHNGWLGIKLVGTAAVDAIAHGLEGLFAGLRAVMGPMDQMMDWAVQMGAIDANPFDGIADTLGTFAASSRDVTNQVITDIESTNAAYDRAGKTILEYKQLVLAGADAQAVAAVATRSSAAEHSSAYSAVGRAAAEAAKKAEDDFFARQRETDLQIAALNGLEDAKSVGMDSWQRLAEINQEYNDQTATAIDEQASGWSGLWERLTAEATDAAGTMTTEFGNWASQTVMNWQGMGTAWSDLWQGMLAIMIQTLGQMAAEWAASEIASIALSYFHSGTGIEGVLKQDEGLAVVQEGEIIMNREESAQFRNESSKMGLSGGFSGGFGPTVGGMFAGYLAGEYFKDVASAYVSNPKTAVATLASLSTFTGNVTAAGLKTLGDVVGVDPTATSIGLTAGAIGAGLLGLGTAGVGMLGAVGMMGVDAVMDAVGVRGFESLRDAMEDKYGEIAGRISFSGLDMTPAQIQAAEIAVRLDHADPNDAISDATSNDAGWTSPTGSQFGSDVDAAENSGGYDSDSSSSGTGVGGVSGADLGKGDESWATGGIVNSLIVPQGDDGFGFLKLGEGVIDADTMKILSAKIRSGSLDSAAGTTEIASALVALSQAMARLTAMQETFGVAIAANTKKCATILDRIQVLGIPEATA